MTAPLVTVCIPTRDRIGFLRESLQGILAQDHRPLEIVISDNWSEDGTREHCLELAARDARVCYIRPPERVGLYTNHNFALRHARGSYVCIFHDDDRYEPTIVSRYVGFLERHPTAGAVGSDWRRIDASGRVAGIRRHRSPALTSGLDYIERTLASGRTSLALSGSMFRREALGPEPFDEDGPLGFTDVVAWFRLAERYEIGHIGEPLWSYRAHPGALSQKPADAVAADYARAFEPYCDEYVVRHPAATERAARWRAAIRRYRFWALFYDTTTRLARRGSSRGIPPELSSAAAGPLQLGSLALMRALAGAGWRWPFVLLARYGIAGRWLIGIR